MEVMTRVLMIAKSARRRRGLRALLRTFGAGMVFASIAGVLTILFDRGFALGLGWPVLAAPAAVTLLVFMVPVVLRRDSLENAAAELDENLHLCDRISTGVAFANLEHPGPFETLAQRDAEAAAQIARVREGVPVGLSRSHRWWPPLAAVAVALAVWLPAWPSPDSPLARSAADLHERAEERERVAEQLEDVSMMLEEQPELFDDETRRELEALEQIERELALDESDPEEAAARAAEALSDAAERLEEKAMRDQEALDATTERFADAGDDPLGVSRWLKVTTMPAAEELAAMRESLDSATDEERERMAERMRELAESIDTDAQEEPPTAAERLESEGVDPQTPQEAGDGAEGQRKGAGGGWSHGAWTRSTRSGFLNRSRKTNSSGSRKGNRSRMRREDERIAAGVRGGVRQPVGQPRRIEPERRRAGRAAGVTARGPAG